MSTKARRKPKPGDFYATCNLVRPHLIADLPHYLRREYADKGWKTARRTVSSKGRRLSGECYLEPLCEGHEFTDPQGFERHMREVHGKKALGGYNAGLVRAASGKWRAPRAAGTETPLSDAVLAKHDLYVCKRCGLTAQLTLSSADYLWRSEHERMCAGVALDGAA